MKKDLINLEVLFEIVRTLRCENGCPWDKKQTPETLLQYFFDELHELKEAIEKDDLENICEELGDLLFLLVFMTQLFKDEFTIDNVIDNVAKKMIRRHPHVYSDAKISNIEELKVQWDFIKELEKTNNKD